MEPLVNATTPTFEPSLLVVAGNNDATRGSTNPGSHHEAGMQGAE